MKNKNLEKFKEVLLELIDIERQEEIERMEEEIRKLSGKKREELGRAILNLSGKFVGREMSFYLVKFFRDIPIDTEIRVGDEVLISLGNPLQNGIGGTVIEKGKFYITVAFKEDVPKFLYNSDKIRIDLYVSDVTFKRMESAILNTTDSGDRYLKLLIGLEEPLETKEYTIESFFDKGLNFSQMEAVKRALGSPDFFLVHGPFGTGKTRTLTEIILQEVHRGKKVLVTAPTNVAVDNLVEMLYGKVRLVRLGHPARILPHLKETSIFHLLETHQKYNKIKEYFKEIEKLKAKQEDEGLKPEPKYSRGLSWSEIKALGKVGKSVRGIPVEIIKMMALWIENAEKIKKLMEKIRDLEESISLELVESSEVILATLSSADLDILENIYFDVVVIDEATQATIPLALIAINKAEKFIMGGDHKQLSPIVLSPKASSLAISPFEVLIKRYPHKSSMLKVQYRMNEKLMSFPNKMFYEGKLIADETVKNITLRDKLNIDLQDIPSPWSEILDPDNVSVFVDTSPLRYIGMSEETKGSSMSKENVLEAKVVSIIASSYFQKGLDPYSVGIISPYKSQILLLKDLLRKYVEKGLEIQTVDGFQGREKDVIIFSVVRSNEEKEIGFLKDLKRLNVAITRAKRKLIIVGDSKTLYSFDVYREIIEHHKSFLKYVEIYPSDIVGIKFGGEVIIG